MAVQAVVGNVFQRGAKEEMKDFIVEVITEKTNSKDFMEGVMNNKTMTEIRAVEKLKTIHTILTTKDSSNVDYMKILSENTGKTTSAILDSVTVLIKRMEYKYKYITEEECVVLIKRHTRRTLGL